MRRGSPLPIPNREVKPRSADDTAIKRGKVGSRHIILTKAASDFIRRHSFSGCSVVRSSRLVWDQEVASSNLAIPTLKRFNLLKIKSLFLCTYSKDQSQKLGSKGLNSKICGSKPKVVEEVGFF